MIEVFGTTEPFSSPSIQVGAMQGVDKVALCGEEHMEV